MNLIEKYLKIDFIFSDIKITDVSSRFALISR